MDYSLQEDAQIKKALKLGMNAAETARYLHESKLLPKRSLGAIKLRLYTVYKSCFTKEGPRGRKPSINWESIDFDIIRELNLHPYNMETAFENVAQNHNLGIGVVKKRWYKTVRKKALAKDNTPFAIAGNSVYANIKNVKRGKESNLPQYKLAMNGFILNSATLTCSPNFSF